MRDEPLWRRYRRFLRADPRRDVDEEIAFHLAMRVDEYQRAGKSLDQAREEAMHRFGSVDTITQECREIDERRAARERRGAWWQALTRDVALGARSLAMRRGFTLAVIATMALGVG